MCFHSDNMKSRLQLQVGESGGPTVQRNHESLKTSFRSILLSCVPGPI